ncbi:MAG: hypothetical protein IH825_00595 [Candidatus Marinimicrobia bacterium]|nr:hypothetical protein [Candidatus Neomarinimicrobiota bacterium]
MVFTGIGKGEFANIMSPESNRRPTSSKAKAVLMSIILPGTGERATGNYTSAKLFNSTESALWLSLFWFKKTKDWRREDYEVYASANAGVDNEGKNELYYANVGNYSDVYEYNSAERRSRNPAGTYDSQDYFWSWSSDETRLQYKSLRKDSELAGQNLQYTIVGLILNRLLSVMNTVYRYNKNVRMAMSIESGSVLIDRAGATKLSLSVRF